MDRKITARYFKVTPHEHNINFEVALREAYDSGKTPKSRELEVSEGAIIRLERLSVDKDGIISGEVVRVQRDNIPPQTSDEGLSPLTLRDGGGLGHCVAFRYDPARAVMGIQFDNRAVSVGKFLLYITKMTDKVFDRSAVLTKDAWEKFKVGEDNIRLFEVCVARSGNFAENAEENISPSTRSMAEHVTQLSNSSEAPIITVTLSMGRGSKEKSMDMGFVRRSLTGLLNSDEDVRKARAKVKTTDGATLPIDFLQEALSDSETLEELSTDPEKNYTRRKNWLNTAMEGHDEIFDNLIKD